MLKYIFRRILTFIPTLLIISLFAFLISLGAPGDPVERLLRSADTEGGTSESASAADAQRQKLRAELGLDKPVFYFSVSPMCQSDTLYRIGDRAHKTMLRKLTNQTGNWPKVDAYYKALLAAKAASDDTPIDQIVAANSTTTIDSTIVDFELKVDTVVNEKYSKNEVTEAKNRSSIELVSLLQTPDAENISSRFDTLTALYDRTEYLGGAKTAFQDVKTAYEDLQNNNQTWKSYMPSFNWYGLANQYHIWLFGNRPYAQGKKQLARDKASLDQPMTQKVEISDTTFVSSKIKIKSTGHTIPAHLLRDMPVLKLDRGKGERTFTYAQLRDAKFKFGYAYDDKVAANPGSPLEISAEVTEEAKEYVNLSYALDVEETPKFDPAKVRGGIFRGDFGLAYKDGQPISTKLGERVKWSLLLSFFGIFIAYVVSIPIGIYSAYRKDQVFDRSSSVILFILYSLPSFFVGTLLLYGFANPDSLVWFPASGIEDPSTFDPDNMNFIQKSLHRLPFFVLPVITYAYGSLAFLSRIMRVGMVEIFGQDFIRTARAKGLSENKVVLKHALRNSLIPIITVFANIFPAAIGGSIIIEKIFGIPGMGAWILESVINQDYPVIVTIFTILGFVTMIGYLISDILYAVVDPRISYK